MVSDEAEEEGAWGGSGEPLGESSKVKSGWRGGGGGCGVLIGSDGFFRLIDWKVEGWRSSIVVSRTSGMRGGGGGAKKMEGGGGVVDDSGVEAAIGGGAARNIEGGGCVVDDSSVAGGAGTDSAGSRA